MLNTIVIMVFDECGGKSVFGIPSNVSLIKDLSLIKDRSHIDTSVYPPGAMGLINPVICLN